ncbi:MAG: sialidase family protein [Edaphobacter sp.]|uniref:sialidase family protein n=1 Tax=Edaphobacter sp. TaxID=1934404 RepID=UPI0023A6F03A|nr:sialidase family protein [Edaphobacter sp.]MDE1176707.1 sialidase family protein [Edaphobacter sp.]
MGQDPFRQFADGCMRVCAAATACGSASLLFLSSFFSPALMAQQSLTAPWQPLGPVQVTTSAYGKVTGRVTSIAVDPADATGNTVYLGTTGGGVWRSVNALAPAASVSFAPLTDTLPVFSLSAGSSALPSLAIGALSAANGVVLAGTGDPNNAADSYYGEGVLRSADDGVTWTVARISQDGTYGTHSFAGLAFAGFAWSTASPGTVVAAVTNSGEGALVGAANASSVMGLYYSTDAGVTWQMATVMDGSQYVQRPRIAGSYSGNAATAVVWNPVRKKFYAAVRYHGYYESADGATWTRLAAQPGAGLTAAACPANTDLVGSLGCPIFRGALAVEPVSGDMVALTVDAANLDQGLWRDACAEASGACAGAVSFAQRLGGSSLDLGSAGTSGNATAIAQASYNLALAAVASGTDMLVFAGTEDLYRCSLASGCATMRNTTNALNGCAAPAKVAPAQHAIAAVARPRSAGDLCGERRRSVALQRRGKPAGDAVFERRCGALREPERRAGLAGDGAVAGGASDRRGDAAGRHGSQRHGGDGLCLGGWGMDAGCGGRGRQRGHRSERSFALVRHERSWRQHSSLRQWCCLRIDGFCRAADARRGAGSLRPDGGADAVAARSGGDGQPVAGDVPCVARSGDGRCAVVGE